VSNPWKNFDLPRRRYIERWKEIDTEIRLGGMSWAWEEEDEGEGREERPGRRRENANSSLCILTPLELFWLQNSDVVVVCAVCYSVRPFARASLLLRLSLDGRVSELIFT